MIKAIYGANIGIIQMSSVAGFQVGKKTSSSSVLIILRLLYSTVNSTEYFTDFAGYIMFGLGAISRIGFIKLTGMTLSIVILLFVT